MEDKTFYRMTANLLVNTKLLAAVRGGTRPVSPRELLILALMVCLGQTSASRAKKLINEAING